MESLNQIHFYFSFYFRMSLCELQQGIDSQNHNIRQPQAHPLQQSFEMALQEL